MKYPNEWVYGKDDPQWRRYLDMLERQWKACGEAFIETMSWMKQVPGLGPDVWHLHPLVFLDAVSSQNLIQIDKFLEEYEIVHLSFATGTPVLSEDSRHNLRKLLESLNSYYSTSEDYKPNIYKLAYMMATARHETYHFPTAEFFSEKPEVGSVTYFNKYDPILADTQERKNTAIAHENTAQGDGYKFRGRGCVHLTWKIRLHHMLLNSNLYWQRHPHTKRILIC